MRVHIWQQFSSNHSAGFTFVGEFQSRDDAERAAAELRRIFQTVIDWYAAHPGAEEEYLQLEGGNPLTPPEIEFIKQYNVEPNPKLAIDWLSGDYLPKDVIIVWDRLILFEPPTNTWWEKAQPLDKIVEKLGGRPLEAENLDLLRLDITQLHGVIIIDVICNAPDEKAAQIIAYDLHAWQREGEAITREIKTGKKEEISSGSTRGLPRIVGDMSVGEVAKTRNCPIKIDGRQLTFEGWLTVDAYQEIPDLFAWLQKRGCTDIRYRLNSDIDQNGQFHSLQLP